MLPVPYWRSDCGRHTLYHGDCLAILPHLSGVDAVVTDPPYGTGAWIRPMSGAGSDCRAVKSTEWWDKWGTQWMDQAWRFSRGRIAFFCSQVNLPSVFVWCEKRPWRLFVWHKSDPRPRFCGQPSYAFECLVCVGGYEYVGGGDVILASSPRIRRDADGTGHPHQKPIKAVRWAVELATPVDQTVLDPFAGSGTTGVACAMTGRRFIGIELDEKYCAIAKRRIKEAASHLFVPAETNPPDADPPLFD